MSSSRLRVLSGGRKAAMAAGVLGVMGALGLGVVSPANASPSGSTAGGPVTLTITQSGNYVAALCGMDNLEGRCTFDVPTGESATFTVRPRAGEPVHARVVPNKGGFAETSAVPDGAEVCFEAGGTRKSPTVTQVSCG